MQQTTAGGTGPGNGTTPSAAPPLRILLVEDEACVADPLATVLGDEGHVVTVATDGAAAMSFLDHATYDLVVSDIRLPKVDGLTLFRRVRRESPRTQFILMSAYGSVAEAVSAMKGKAAHYLSKPFELEELLETVRHVQLELQVHHELEGARRALDTTELDGAYIVGRSPSITALKTRVAAIADSEAAVLLTGESGTGKELVAHALHRYSSRRTAPFVAINCAAFPDTLLEAELFGYARGAFTGAFRNREGRFQAANGGTLFLDEVAEISIAAQAKLLRVIETGSFQPLGTNETVHARVRLVSATNVDLRGRVEAGLFREDLFYRLKVFHLQIPALRERRSDLPLLVEHFLEKLSPVDRRSSISPRAWAALSHYAFPGNVRELKHAIHHALVLSAGEEIDLEHLPDELRVDTEISEDGREAPVRPLAAALNQFERSYLIRVIKHARGNKTRAAEILGISRKNLWEKLKRYGVADTELGDRN